MHPVVTHLIPLLSLLVAFADPPYAKESGPKNLPCSDTLSILREATFNLFVGPVHLRNGEDCLSEPGFPCEWDVQLTRAETWGTTGEFLIVIINANHLLGSGAWDSLFLYVCKHGTFEQVFADRLLYGVKVELGRRDDLWTTAGVWGPRDPTCCPSSERRTHLMWNGRRNRFVVVESTTSAMKRPN